MVSLFLAQTAIEVVQQFRRRIIEDELRVLAVVELVQRLRNELNREIVMARKPRALLEPRQALGIFDESPRFVNRQDNALVAGFRALVDRVEQHFRHERHFSFRVRCLEIEQRHIRVGNVNVGGLAQMAECSARTERCQRDFQP